MNVEIESKATQFHLWEYIQIGSCLQCGTVQINVNIDDINDTSLDNVETMR